MSDTFPTGERYIVDGVETHAVVGKRLHFVLPSGRSKWVGIGFERDTPQLRDRIAEHLRTGDRYVNGERIGP